MEIDPLMERGPGGDLSKTIDRHSGPGAVSQERAFRVKVPVALVAFRRFFTAIYTTATCYGEVGQLQRYCTTFLPVYQTLGFVSPSPGYVDRFNFLSPAEEAIFLSHSSPSRTRLESLPLTRFC